MEELNQTLKIMNNMLRIKVFLLVAFYTCIAGAALQGQQDYVLNERLKTFIFTSIETDGNRAFQGGAIKEWIDLVENHYDNIEIISSKEIVFYNPKTIDYIQGKYTIRLFKIEELNSKKQSRYLMHVRNMHNEVWLRVGGYVENDVNHLYNHFRKIKMKKKDLIELNNYLESSESMFLELDLSCMLRGYLKKKTDLDCFDSVYYIESEDQRIGFTVLNEKEIKSTFSRMPLSGRFKDKL